MSGYREKVVCNGHASRKCVGLELNAAASDRGLFLTGTDEDGRCVSMHLDRDELQTVLGEYATVTPKEQPPPARWVVEIEDCLRPWESQKRGPFESEGAAEEAAQAMAGRVTDAANGELGWSYSGLPVNRLTVSDRAATLHYRLTWREETEADR